MIAYEKALEIAKREKKNIDFCIEYENGYVFGNDSNEETIGGYGNTRCVVLKSDGKVIPMNAFVIYGTGEEIKTFDV